MRRENLRTIGLFVVALATVLLAGGTARAAPVCRYGSWADENREVKAHGWKVIELTDAERDTIVTLYKREAHEKIEAAHAWEESRRDFDSSGIVEYSVVFLDTEECIQFRLNFAGTAAPTHKLEPGTVSTPPDTL